MKQHDNTLLLSKNTRKINKTVASGETKVENKHDLIEHAAQEKVATSTHSMNDVIAFYIFNPRFESRASTTQKDSLFCTK